MAFTGDGVDNGCFVQERAARIVGSHCGPVPVQTISVADLLSANPDTPPIEAAFEQFLRDNGKRFDETFSIKADDRVVLGALMRRFKPKTIIETGTNIGTSSVIMALSSEAHILTFDIADMVPGPSQCHHTRFGYLFRNTPLSARIDARYGSTFSLDPAGLPVADVWFVDSNHDFQTVEHETNLAVKNMAARGGVIIYHDASPAGHCESEVAKFLTGRFKDWTLVDTHYGMAYVELPRA